MKAKKAIAIVMAALMLMSIGVALSATNVNAASMTVELKKPVDGKTWKMGQEYEVS